MRKAQVEHEMIFCSPQFPWGAPSCRLSFQTCSLSWSQSAPVWHIWCSQVQTDVKTHISSIKHIRMRDGPGEARVIYEPFYSFSRQAKEKFSLVPEYSSEWFHGVIAIITHTRTTSHFVSFCFSRNKSRISHLFSVQPQSNNCSIQSWTQTARL